MLDDSLTAGRLDLTAPRPAPHLEVGDRFAGYEVRGLLGHGAMGPVYEASTANDERRVTLKLVRDPPRRAADRLLRESRALARLDHPNVVEIAAADVERDAVYLVMELVEGQNLREWLATPRTWAEVLPVLIGAGRGLAAAHAAGILHRDVKPENILVDPDGRARVLDFGVARMSPEHPEHTTATGDSADIDSSDRGDAPPEAYLPEASPRDAIAYMAPEQHERGGANFRSDQFGLCVTAFEAIYGAHPFPVARAQALVDAANAGQITFPHDARARAPRWLERAIVRGLSAQPEDRFATMEALLDALERHPARRRQTKGALGVAAAAVVAIAVAAAVPIARGRGACTKLVRELDALGSREPDNLQARQLSKDQRARLERLHEGLDAWAVRWLDARTEQCERALEPAAIERAGTRALEAAQVRCFDDQLRAVGSLATLLREGDAQTLQGLAAGAENARLALPDPTRCLEREPLPTLPDPNFDPAVERELHMIHWLSVAAPNPALTARVNALVNEHEADDRSERAIRLRCMLALARAKLGAESDPVEAKRLAQMSVKESERLGLDVLRAEATVLVGRALVELEGPPDLALAVLYSAEALFERVRAPTWLRERQKLAVAQALFRAGERARSTKILEAVAAAARERGDTGLADALDRERTRRAAPVDP